MAVQLLDDSFCARLQVHLPFFVPGSQCNLGVTCGDGDPRFRLAEWMVVHRATVQGGGATTPAVCKLQVDALGGQFDELRTLDHTLLEQSARALDGVCPVADSSEYVTQMWQPLVRSWNVRGEERDIAVLSLSPWTTAAHTPSRLLQVDLHNKVVGAFPFEKIREGMRVRPILRVDPIWCHGRKMVPRLWVTDMLVGQMAPDTNITHVKRL
jgi:hypothetical protein